MNATATKNQPVKAFRRGACSVALFENKARINGQNIDVLKAHVQRRYLDKDGKWQSTSSFGVNDLPKITLCLTDAYRFMTEAASDTAAGNEGANEEAVE